MADEENVWNVREDLVGYTNLVGDFLSGKEDVNNFEKKYLRMFKDDPLIRGDSSFRALEDLFFSIDDFFVFPEFSEEEARQEVEKLRDAARRALDQLLKMPAD